MPIIRAQVVIPATSNVSEDACVNTFHFFADDTSEGTVGSIQTALVAFYEALDAYKSNLMQWTTARVKWYDLEDPEPRVPFENEVLGLSATGGSGSLPRELAVCVSFAADYVSGSSAARRRGRIYFGPLASAAAGSDGRIVGALVTAAVTAASGLYTTSALASEWSWGVYSPTAGALYQVTNGWVDNEFDIQRRRGTRPTVRTVW